MNSNSGSASHIVKRLLLSSLALAVLAATPAARAETYWWDTTSTSLWGTNTNWWTTAAGTANPAAAPLSTDSVVFNGTGVNGAETVQLGAATSITGITFDNTGTTLISSNSTTSNALSIDTGGITINSGVGAVTIGHATNLAPITLTGAQS